MKIRFTMADVTAAAWLLASLSAVSPASAGGPAIKTQQCNVTFPTTPITLTPDLYVANRGGSITVYELDDLPSPSTANADVLPVAMMLHDPTTNELAGPVGLYVKVP